MHQADVKSLGDRLQNLNSKFLVTVVIGNEQVLNT